VSLGRSQARPTDLDIDVSLDVDVPASRRSNADRRFIFSGHGPARGRDARPACASPDVVMRARLQPISSPPTYLDIDVPVSVARSEVSRRWVCRIGREDPTQIAA
jgi:hypothetical protein